MKALKLSKAVCSALVPVWLLPLKDPNYDPRSGEEGFVEKDLTYQRLLKDFSYRGLQNPRIFYDENNLRFPANYRDKFARLANA